MRDLATHHLYCFSSVYLSGCEKRLQVKQEIYMPKANRERKASNSCA